MAEPEYAEICRRCRTPLDMVRATFSEEFWRCPKCGCEERHHIRPLIPKSTDNVRVFVLWKSGTRLPTESELSALRQLHPPFNSVAIEHLQKQFEGLDRIDLGVLPWDRARTLIERAWKLDLWPGYELA